MKATYDVLHIYGQTQWHDEAWVCGSAAALRKLRDAIDRALETGLSVVSDVCYVNDGEGFEVRVIPVSSEAALDKLALPYTDEIASEKKDGVIWPHELLGRGR